MKNLRTLIEEQEEQEQYKRKDSLEQDVVLDNIDETKSKIEKYKQYNSTFAHKT